MFRTLYFKLAAVLVGLFCLIGILFILLSLFTTRVYFQEVNQMLNRNLAQHLISERILMQAGRVNEPVVKHVFHQLMVVNPGIEVYLLDSSGRILAFSAPPGKVKRQTVSLDPLKKFLDETGSFPILGDDPRDLARKKVFSVAPIPIRGQIEGYLYVILGGEEFESAAQLLQNSYILRISIGIGVGVLMFALITALLLFNRMTRPLHQLTTAMETFRRGDFSEPPDFLSRFTVRSGNEIERLGKIFMEMADHIVRQIKELRRADRLRREFAANITHDLRAPLTSLRGYLETLLLKEGQLTAEEHRDYIAIALKHSTQLGKLVSELFELAKLDSPDVQIHFESFVFFELIQDIIQKFHLSVERKRITLRANIEENTPLIFADIGLIERVFENLIENALRYTPEAGVITVSAAFANGQVKVQVEDTGSGIQPEYIPYLFDRFHRMELNHKGSSGGSGLGLAITKRILELHGSSIEVNSEVNVGTIFTFILPVYKTEA